MKVAILDDHFETPRTLACFEQLAAHDVTVFTEGEWTKTGRSGRGPWAICPDCVC